MSETLPPEIGAPLHEAAAQLTRWAWSHPDVPLATIEQRLVEEMRSLLPTLLAAVVRRTTRSLVGHHAPPPLPCPGCGQVVRVQSWRSRRVETIAGPLAIERPGIAVGPATTAGARPIRPWRWPPITT